MSNSQGPLKADRDRGVRHSEGGVKLHSEHVSTKLLYVFLNEQQNTSF